MIRIIALLGLTFLLASCGDEPEKEAVPETSQTPADDLATAKAEANAMIVIAKTLKADVATEKVKYLKPKIYKKAVNDAETFALQLEIDLTTATDVNKIKADTKELGELIAITALMTKKSATLADAKAQANKIKGMANRIDPAIVTAGAGHDELVSQINDAKHTADDTKGIGKLDAAIANANDDDNPTRTTLDEATHALEQEIVNIYKLYKKRAKAIDEAKAMIARANGFADAHGGLYVDGPAYNAAVLAAKTGDKNAADKLTAVIADNTTNVAKVESKTTKLKTLIDAIEAVGTIAKQAAAMAKYTALTLATATDAALTDALADLKALNAAQKAYDANAATNAITAIEDEQNRRTAVAAAVVIANGYTATEIANARALLDTTNDDGNNSDGKTAFANPNIAAASRATYLAAIQAAEGAVATAITAINAAANAAAANAVTDNGSALHTAIHTTLAQDTQAFRDAIAKNP